MRFEFGLLTVEATGEFSLEEAQQAFLEMLGAVVQYQSRKVFLDGRTMTGKPEHFERFLYSEFAANETLRVAKEHGLVPRFAYVLRQPLRDPGRFGENVAVNRGMNVKTFEIPEAAFQWLEVPPANKPDANDA